MKNGLTVRTVLGSAFGPWLVAHERTGPRTVVWRPATRPSSGSAWPAPRPTVRARGAMGRGHRGWRQQGVAGATACRCSHAAGSGARARRRWGGCTGQETRRLGTPNRRRAGGAEERRGAAVVNGGGAGAVVAGDGPCSAPRGGGRGGGEVGRNLPENGRGWRLTEQLNGGGNVAKNRRGERRSEGGQTRGRGGLTAGCSRCGRRRELGVEARRQRAAPLWRRRVRQGGSRGRRRVEAGRGERCGPGWWQATGRWRASAGSGPRPAGASDVSRARAAGRTDERGKELTGGPRHSAARRCR
jgi:hypothetical protein